VRTILILVVLALLRSAPGVVTPALVPRLSAQSSAEGQREMSREEGMALHEWAQRYLKEVGAQGGDGSQDLPADLERLRAMYFMSVEDRGWLRNAEDLLHNLEGRVTTESGERVTLDAYRGALEVVRARHARWPPTKLGHLREGVGILDRIVGEEPENLEARYLRLVSCYYLPFFLKREKSVQEDFRILVADLPYGQKAFSPAVYQGVVRFVLDNGDLSPQERTLLQQSLDSLRDPPL
jgi:hypothetical protein